MPLLLSLAAPGSPYRSGRRATRLAHHLYRTLPAAQCQTRNLSLLTTRPRCVSSALLPPVCPATPWTWGVLASCCHEGLLGTRRRYSIQAHNHANFPESHIDAFIINLRLNDGKNEQSLLDMMDYTEEHTQFRAQLSRNARKARRQSRPATLLASIGGPARELYFIAPSSKNDLSYTQPRRVSGKRRQPSKAVPSPSDPFWIPESVSLYSVLARYLAHHTVPRLIESEFRHTQAELDLLRARGYTLKSVEQWASCLTDSRSIVAAKIFESSIEKPPLFLLLLFLRRKYLRVFALGIIMRHLKHRAETESMSWAALKIITIRLLRHGRELWPESMPWMASFFATEACRLHDDAGGSRPLSPQILSDVTQFCNNYLLLLSLPATTRPVVFSTHQEKAQFQILQYMASNSPAIVVTRLGFRSVTRNQLAHAKTLQEREWAELKGASWPPWKENRTAMDEDKSYEFGASRASKILHRMYEAGYGGRIWEELAQVYAGWDTDSSPTIQTRTSLPHFSSQYGEAKRLRPLLWAGRIRTTRTRREAWACFLSYELSGEAAHSEIYLAMFEKLYYAPAERSNRPDFSPDSSQDLQEAATDVLPGDMKEVLPDPLSSLHYVFLSEPVPAYKQLLHRMHAMHVQPSSRLLAFLLETCPGFDMGLDMLAVAKDKFDGGMGRILSGMHDDNSAVHSIPGYLFTAILRFLCRFGRFEQPPSKMLTFLPPEQHIYQLKLNRQYLLEYAYALLAFYRPKYRPAWAVFVSKLVQQKGSELAGNTIRYTIICDMIEHMEQTDVDVDDELFRLVCTATLYAAQAVNQGAASIEDARYLHTTGSSRLRTLFHGLVGANADMQSPVSNREMGDTVPPHVPGPAEFHAYVRALGILRDHEGLYSFTTWLTKHQAEVTARAKAQRSGRQILFRTLVALRIALNGAPEEIAHLIKTQIEGVEEWGGWPAQDYVDMYMKGHLKTAMPSVGGR
ncbi:hypothetical protein EJ02DRAFT_500034 [Clathrospora elynae]|uniref:Uncharacterized protein n=1 Tax=Clathrospora elynae TaxID=706981 RepID=A0A6A5T2T8_9PLEO|nr:hypothetical protein EJ02DRAFT_500034 [Clathrospora elynae]